MQLQLICERRVMHAAWCRDHPAGQISMLTVRSSQALIQTVSCGQGTSPNTGGLSVTYGQTGGKELTIASAVSFLICNCYSRDDYR